MTIRVVPAAPAQQRMWLLAKLYPHSASYVIASPMELTGPLDVNALRAAARDLADRHELLRATFQEQGQSLSIRIEDAGQPAITLLDMTAQSDPRASAEAAARAIGERPMDLASGPLARLLLCQLAPKRHILTLFIHHIIADAWTVALLWEDLGLLYGAHIGEEVTLPPTGKPYSSYAREQVEAAASSRAREELTEWLRRLDCVSIDNSLRTDRQRTAMGSSEGNTLSLTLPADLVRRVQAAGRQRRCTPFMALLAGFAATMAHYDRRQDVLLATQFAGRSDPGVARTAGFFVNTLPIRFSFDDATTMSDALAQARRGTLAAYATEHVTYEQLVHELAPLGDRSMNPLAQVAFQLLNVPMPPVSFGRLVTHRWWDMTRDAKFDISVSLIPEPDGSLRGLVTYAVNLFDESTVSSLWDAYLRALEAFVSDPQGQLWAIDLTNAAQRRMLENICQGSPCPGNGRTLLAEIERHATERSDSVALRTVRGETTYAELWARSGRNACTLREAGVPSGGVVAIAGDDREAAAGAILGAWRAGASVVVLDTTAGTARFEQVLSLLDVSAGLAPAGTAPSTTGVRWLPAASGPPDRSGIPCAGIPDSAWAVKADAPAYYLTTSGSTGHPRVVAASMTAFSDFLVREAATVSAEWTVIQAPPLSYDPGMRDVFLTLAAGACLHITQDAEHPVEAIVRCLRTGQADAILAIVPSVLDAVITELETSCPTGHDGSRAVPALAAIRCCGEALPRRLAERAADLLGCVPHNDYGPSECTMVSCSGAEQPEAGNTPLMPIGVPVPGAQVWVLGRRMQLLPPRFTGEIVIGGGHVSEGYIGDPAATQRSFFSSPSTGARLHRTGDLGYVTPRGALQWLGRIDRQVKIRGVRVDVVEVEETLRLYGAVTDAAVVAVGDGPARSLVAYVTGLSDAQLTDLRDFLRPRLPRAGIPAAIQVLDVIPRTERGKLLSAMLPAVTPHQSHRKVRRPAAGTENDVATIFAGVLGTDEVGADSDFFELGGHSLSAVTTVGRLNARTGCQLTIGDIFDHPVVHELADYIETRRQQADTPTVPTGGADPQGSPASLLGQ